MYSGIQKFRACKIFMFLKVVSYGPPRLHLFVQNAVKQLFSIQIDSKMYIFILAVFSASLL